MKGANISKKHSIVTTICLIVLIVGIIGMIFSFLQAQTKEVKTQELTVGNVQLDVDGAFTFTADMGNLKPGDMLIEDEISITSTASVNTYILISLNLTVKKAGSDVPVDTTDDLYLLMTQALGLDQVSDSIWTEVGTGYYLYGTSSNNHILEADNDEIITVIDSIGLSTTYTEKYVWNSELNGTGDYQVQVDVDGDGTVDYTDVSIQGAKVSLNFKAYQIQADNLGESVQGSDIITAFMLNFEDLESAEISYPAE